MTACDQPLKTSGGAGAVIDYLYAAGWTELSPEADSARTAYQAVSESLFEHLRACASGRELISAGYAADISLAAELNHSTTVPRLHNGCFIPG